MSPNLNPMSTSGKWAKILDKTVLGGKIWRPHVPMTATIAKKASGKL